MGQLFVWINKNKHRMNTASIYFAVIFFRMRFYILQTCIYFDLMSEIRIYMNLIVDLLFICTSNGWSYAWTCILKLLREMKEHDFSTVKGGDWTVFPVVLLIPVYVVKLEKSLWKKSLITSSTLSSPSGCTYVS